MIQRLLRVVLDAVTPMARELVDFPLSWTTWPLQDDKCEYTWKFFLSCFSSPYLQFETLGRKNTPPKMRFDATGGLSGILFLRYSADAQKLQPGPMTFLLIYNYHR